MLYVPTHKMKNYGPELHITYKKTCAGAVLGTPTKNAIIFKSNSADCN